MVELGRPSQVFVTKVDLLTPVTINIFNVDDVFLLFFVLLSGPPHPFHLAFFSLERNILASDVGVSHG